MINQLMMGKKYSLDLELLVQSMITLILFFCSADRSWLSPPFYRNFRVQYTEKNMFFFYRISALQQFFFYSTEIDPICLSRDSKPVEYFSLT